MMRLGMRYPILFLFFVVLSSATQGQMTPEEYGQAVGAGFQNSYQNMLMGMQAAREQRDLEIRIRQQQLAERESRMEQEVSRKRIELIDKQIELNRKLEKQNEELERKLNESQQTTGSSAQKKTDYEATASDLIDPKLDEYGRPIVSMPTSLQGEAEKISKIIENIRQHIDRQIISGRISDAENAPVPENLFAEFYGEKKEQIKYFVNYEVERYKRFALKTFK